MKTEDLIDAVIGWSLTSIVFGLALYYLLSLPILTSLEYGFILGLITVMGHELAHLLTAKTICHIKQTDFILTHFAIILSLFSILLLLVFIYIKQTTGFITYFLPILASPGAVYVDLLRTKKCGDDVAIAGPLYNFIVGIIGLIYLYQITRPPFILNQSTPTALVALITYFSFALAFFNALPLKFSQSVALDGYHALTMDKSDILTKILVPVIVVVSFYIIFVTHWWVVVIRG